MFVEEKKKNEKMKSMEVGGRLIAKTGQIDDKDDDGVHCIACIPARQKGKYTASST